jgi:methylthioribose-1-phosphate isomerase
VLERAYCTETRPYNQGTRLTAFELVHDGIPATLIADCMAAALFRSLGSGDGVHAVVAGAAGAAGAVGATGATGAADAMEQQRQREEQKDQQELRVGDSSGGGDGSANSSNSKYGRAAPAAEPAPAPMASPASPAVVIVGADRVAANGDTANKIGTYALAILARHHGLKFLVAAPRTTIDRRTPSGAHIVIEERPGEELARVSGAVYRRRPDPAGDPADGNSIMVGREHGEAGNEEGGEGEGDARARAGEAAAAAAAAAVKEGRGKGKEDDGVVDLQTVTVAAPGIDIWNPAFDVTPAALIDAIVTERGVVEKARPDGVFDFGPIFRD